MVNDKFKFSIEPGLQEIYRDKDTGLPLSGGTITYYRDVSRIELKPVYKLSGTTQDPVFIQLPNPLALTMVGSVSDASPIGPPGDDIKPFYFPFNQDGTQDLYYIVVRDSSGDEQFTREGWPQQIDTSGSTSPFNDIENYVENGQFLMRRIYPVAVNGEIIQQTTNLALGGWIFVMSPGFTSLNFISFDRFTEDSGEPDSGPRYSLHCSGLNPNPAETIKDIRKIYNRVNCFSGDTMTLQFEAKTNNGVNLNVDLLYQKNYGLGGSPQEENYVTSFNIQTDTYEKYKATFTVTDDDGKIFGPNDDDEFRLIFRISTAVSYDFNMTNTLMLLGDFIGDISYPVTSDYQAISKTLGGSIELTGTDDSDSGSVLTITERTDTASADTGQGISSLGWVSSIPVGASIEWWTPNIPNGFFLMDGSTYDLVGTSVLMEATRLWNVVGNIGNARGVDSFYLDSSVINEIQYTAWLPGLVPAPNPQTSGFTINVLNPGDPSTRAILQVICMPASAIVAGSYFQLFANSGRGTVYWFSKDGIGADPTLLFPGQLVSKIDIISSDSAETVSNKLQAQGTTQIVIPNRSGYFSRALDDGAGIDPDAALRTDPTGFDQIGNVPGSIQQDALQDHAHIADNPIHGFARTGGGGTIIGGGSSGVSSPTTGEVDVNGLFIPDGRVSTETRPKDIGLYYIMKN